jgi:hypothetical protein
MLLPERREWAHPEHNVRKFLEVRPLKRASKLGWGLDADLVASRLPAET